MVTLLVLTGIYLLTLYQVIVVAVTGKHVLFPNFRVADEKLLRGSKIWNTWWGKSLYYLFLFSHTCFIVGFLFVFIRFFFVL